MITVRRKKTAWKLPVQIALSVCAFAAVLWIFISGTGRIRRSAEQKGAETLRDSIRRATVECYAIEGRYPPDVKYLEDHYGIRIDRKRFNVFYDGFASNILPDITVVENGAEALKEKEEQDRGK